MNLTVITPGRVPAPESEQTYTRRGRCKHCGCVAEVQAHSRVTFTVDCPTQGCGRQIVFDAVRAPAPHLATLGRPGSGGPPPPRSRPTRS